MNKIDSFEKLNEAVIENGGFLTITMGELFEIHGSKSKITSLLSSYQFNSLASTMDDVVGKIEAMGLKTYPDLDVVFDSPIRVYRSGSVVELLTEALLNPSVENDQLVSKCIEDLDWATHIRETINNSVDVDMPSDPFGTFLATHTHGPFLGE